MIRPYLSACAIAIAVIVGCGPAKATSARRPPTVAELVHGAQVAVIGKLVEKRAGLYRVRVERVLRSIRPQRPLHRGDIVTMRWKMIPAGMVPTERAIWIFERPLGGYGWVGLRNRRQVVQLMDAEKGRQRRRR